MNHTDSGTAVLTRILSEIHPECLIGEPSITWYFWILIGIYLFIPVLNSFIRDYKIKGAEYFLAIWFFTMILKTFNSYPLWHYFNLDMFAGFIGYPVLGYYLANKEFKLNDKKLCISGLIILIISGSLCILRLHKGQSDKI